MYLQHSFQQASHTLPFPQSSLIPAVLYGGKWNERTATVDTLCIKYYLLYCHQQRTKPTKMKKWMSEISEIYPLEICNESFSFLISFPIWISNSIINSKWIFSRVTIKPPTLTAVKSWVGDDFCALLCYYDTCQSYWRMVLLLMLSRTTAGSWGIGM